MSKRVSISIKKEVEAGNKLIKNLPHKFKIKNKGKFIAITYHKKILSICDDLTQLNEKLNKIKPNENYYIARIGYYSIAKFE